MVGLQIIESIINKGKAMKGLNLSGRIRKDIIDAVLYTGNRGAHIGPALSIVEIMIAIYQNYSLNDEFILSKGHGALGYYAVMHQLGIISDDQFASFDHNGGDFPGQPSRSIDNNIIFPSGSLGMGLSYGIGRAVIKERIDNGITYVLMGDGELNEGSVWEAVMLASELKLDNVVAIIDRNKMQSDGETDKILNLEIQSIWKSFSWNVVECDGHNLNMLNAAIETCKKKSGPTVVIANTIKGKGISFIEGKKEWHHHTITQSEYEIAMKELGEKYGLE